MTMPHRAHRLIFSRYLSHTEQGNVVDVMTNGLPNTTTDTPSEIHSKWIGRQVTNNLIEMQRVSPTSATVIIVIICVY